MNVRLLRKIAKIIQEPKTKGQFSMKTWHKDKKDNEAYNILCDLPKEKQISCNTSHCIAGWAQVLSPNRDCKQYADTDAQRILGLDSYQAYRLFYADAWPKGFGKWRATPAQAAARIEHFIKTKGAE